MPPSVSELTPIVFNMKLTHLDLKPLFYKLSTIILITQEQIYKN